MGDEIDSYILVRLEEAIAIADAPSPHFNIATKLFFFKPTLSEQFKSLKNLLFPSPAATNDSATTTATNATNEANSSTSAGGGGVDPTTRLEQLYYLNNVLTEWQMITQDKFSFRNSYSSLQDLRQSLAKIKQDLKRGDGGSSHPHKSDSAPHATVVVHPTTTADEAVTPPEEPRWSKRHAEKQVRGIEHHLLSLERLLVLQPPQDGDDAFNTFGIHGMAGIGKTTMCQAIFTRPKVVDFFFPRIWVCMSKQNEQQNDQVNYRKEIVRRMLTCLGVDKEIIDKIDERKNLRGLVFALRLQLTGKRYLVVLDDAWSEDEWFNLMDSSNEDDEHGNKDTFAYALPKGCGGTVIVTGRTKKVVANMIGERAKLRCLTTLEDETCWEIFKDWVEADETKFPQNLKEQITNGLPLKEQITKRCHGLPLAAKMMGDIIRPKLLTSAQPNQA